MRADEVRIRPEQAADLAAIREVNRRAFGQEQEGVIVDALRANGAALRVTGGERRRSARRPHPVQPRHHRRPQRCGARPDGGPARVPAARHRQPARRSRQRSLNGERLPVHRRRRPSGLLPALRVPAGAQLRPFVRVGRPRRGLHGADPGRRAHEGRHRLVQYRRSSRPPPERDAAATGASSGRCSPDRRCTAPRPPSPLLEVIVRMKSPSLHASDSIEMYGRTLMPPAISVLAAALVVGPQPGRRPPAAGGSALSVSWKLVIGVHGYGLRVVADRSGPGADQRGRPAAGP